MHLQALVLEFSDASHVQRSELSNAAENDMVDEVESLLQLPMDPDAVTGEPNHTPLMVASGNGHVRVVQLLLEAGAQKEAVAADGSTPLMWAALEGRDSVVRLLLEAGAEMDVRDQGGWTALMCSASERHPQVLRLLLEAGADKDVCDRFGQTALMLAEEAEESDDEILRLLEPVAEDDDGELSEA
ncbi:Anks3 [Symbiodinium microadriaticum]|nr:Anks3 [Symbiodinium microadriaticum]